GNKIGGEYTVKNGAAGDSPDGTLLSDGRIAYALGDTSSGDADVTSAIFDPRERIGDLTFHANGGQSAIWLLQRGGSGPNDNFTRIGTGSDLPTIDPSWKIKAAA